MWATQVQTYHCPTATPESIQPDTAKQARDALTHYCKIQMADDKKKEPVYITKRQAGQLLWVGAGFLLVCMGLSLLFSSGNTLNALFGPRCLPKDSTLVDGSFCGISIWSLHVRSHPHYHWNTNSGATKIIFLIDLPVSLEIKPFNDGGYFGGKNPAARGGLCHSHYWRRRRVGCRLGSWKSLENDPSHPVCVQEDVMVVFLWNCWPELHCRLLRVRTTTISTCTLKVDRIRMLHFEFALHHHLLLVIIAMLWPFDISLSKINCTPMLYRAVAGENVYFQQVRP